MLDLAAVLLVDFVEDNFVFIVLTAFGTGEVTAAAGFVSSGASSVRARFKAVVGMRDNDCEYVPGCMLASGDATHKQATSYEEKKTFLREIYQRGASTQSICLRLLHSIHRPVMPKGLGSLFSRRSGSQGDNTTSNASVDPAAQPAPMKITSTHLIWIMVVILGLFVVVVYVFESQVHQLKQEIERVQLLQARQLNANDMMELIQLREQQQQHQSQQQQPQPYR